MKLTIDEYAKEYKMSQEMINSKVRAKKLNYIIEDGVTYIITLNTSTQSDEINSKSKQSIVKSPSKELISSKQKTTVATVLALYQRENRQLKEKINQLEEKIDKLIDDKEQMLRDERDKIESLYTAKDEQLKNILELINSKLMLEREPQTIHEVDPVVIPNTKSPQKKSKKESLEIIELLEYLKTLKLKSNQRKSIKKRFLAVYDSDIRITQKDGKLYLDFTKYDYSDLLEH